MKQTTKFMIVITIILSFFISTVMAEETNKSIVKQMDRVHSKYEARVIGGHVVPRGERTFQVALLNDRGQQVCGGSIIADNWVLTAAHCVDGINITQILSDTQRLNQGGQHHQVSDIKIHPNWTYNVPQGNDIALIRIRDSFDSDLERLKLANITLTNNTQKGIVSGWGYTRTQSNPSNQLREATQTIISDRACERLQGSRMNRRGIICADDLGISSCNGDSGGPFTTERNGVTYSIGIVSYGPYSCTGYSAYTQTDHYVQWINQYIDTDSTPPNTTCPSGYHSVAGSFDSDGFIVLNNKYYYANRGKHSFISTSGGYDMYLYKWNGRWKKVRTSTSTSVLSYKGGSGYYVFGLSGESGKEYNICTKTP